MQGHRIVLEPFGKYVLLDRIGSGGMAEIFRARPTDPNSDGRIVVVKRLLPEITSDPVFLKMFRTEIAISMSLNHPNIVQIHDFGAIGGHPYLAMECVQGQTLKNISNDFRKRELPVPIETTCFIIEKTARGLHYAHTFENQATGKRLNLIHRDMSPENILISYDGQIKIIDFGIAKAALRVCEATHPGLIKGKARYLSPEQIEGDQLDARSDVFQLGIVLWEMLTGYKLFAGKDAANEADSMRLIQTFRAVRKPSEYNPKVPTMLDQIVLRALQRDPKERFQSAAEMEKALHVFLTGFRPGYGALEISELLREQYQTEIIEDAQRLRDMNEHSQSFLTSNETRTMKTRTEKRSRDKPEKKKVSRRFRKELAAWAALVGTALFGVIYGPDLVRLYSEPAPIYYREAQLTRPATGAAGNMIHSAKSILLKISVFPRDTRRADIQVNGRRIDTRNPKIRVPLDQPVRIEVRRPGARDYRTELTLKSVNVGKSREYSYNVVLSPRAEQRKTKRK